MSNEGEFLIYCIEAYKREKHISGRHALSIFEASGALEFILNCYDALHIESDSAIVWQIDDYISHHVA